MTVPPAGPEILLDLRCLQDPNYARRGIGRHALGLLRHARAFLPEARLVGIADPALPSPEGAVLLDTLHPNAGFNHDAACFVQLSPMTHDPLFTARALLGARLRAAVVYDFIPLDSPERYLADQATRTDYLTALRWLARSDLFLPISQAAGAGLARLLRPDPARVIVTGCPLDPGFVRTGKQGLSRHVLVAGGGDPRKDPETAVRAHAAAGLRQNLVIVGGYPEAEQSRLRAVCVAAGGDPARVLAPATVDPATLRQLYADAACVIVPSRDEGFSLPVIEAMASGIPVLASDIPAHRELLAEPQLFAPGDAVALAALLRAAAMPAWREQALAAQAPVWPRFTEQEVAARFWGPIVARLAAAAAAPRATHGPAIGGRRPPLALVSPLPPALSGIADYTATTAAALAQRTALTVFTDTPGAVPVPGAELAALSALPYLLPEGGSVVSVLGNSDLHRTTLRHLLRHGGAVLAHDSRYLGLYEQQFGARFTAGMVTAELGRPVGQAELATWLDGSVSSAATGLGQIAAASSRLLVHSAPLARLVRQRFGTEAIRLPFAIYRDWQPDELHPDRRRAARARLGVAPGEVLIASFGFVHATKSPFDMIWALDLLRAWGIDARLALVGRVLGAPTALQALIAQLGLQDRVRLMDAFTPEQTFRDYLLAADLGLQLRTVGMGSISGALMDCATAGLPSVASRDLVEALEPPAYVRAVPDHPSPVLVAEALADLLEAGRATEAERVAFCQARSPEAYAAALCAALELDA